MGPRALLPAPVARLAALAPFAALGALQWSRYAVALPPWRALLWVLAALATAALVARARSGRALLGALVAGGVLALACSGVGAGRLVPGRWDELLPGLVEGAQGLTTVHLPYAGADPWVLVTVSASGAALCWLAAVLLVWPGGAAWSRGLALALLLVLVVSPVVALGTAHPTLLGAALTLLVAGVLWLDRVARRGLIGVLVLAGAAVLAALPLAGAADRDAPWFDYEAFSERLASGSAIQVDWTQRYGPIDWPREGAEVLRVRASVDRPLYLKAQQLDRFDGRAWTVGQGLGEDEGELSRDWREHPEWDVEAAVTLRRLKTGTVPSPGAALGVARATRAVAPDAVPGPWVVPGGGTLGPGDSYVVRAHVPDPSPAELRDDTADRDLPGPGALEMDLPLPPAARRHVFADRPVRTSRARLQPDWAHVRFPTWTGRGGPVATFPALGLDVGARPLLRRSPYRRTWALARELRARSRTPAEYVLRVSEALRAPAFLYAETPPAPRRGVAPLESFLFDTQAGYCQQYAGAMALLLRMGGVGARVVTGFSPGGRVAAGTWSVRDTDAHAWVEAWFDGAGWVTLDPTPAGTPARSQQPLATPTPAPTAALEQDAAAPVAPNRRPEGAARDAAAPARAAARSGGGGPPVLPVVAAAALLAVLGLLARRALQAARRGPRDPAGDALRELERALRRSGRAPEPPLTLAGLERRLHAGEEAAAYLRAVRAARYGGAVAGPTAAQRAAFRRELAAGLGPLGRLRAWLAVPPRRVRSPSRPR